MSEQRDSVPSPDGTPSRLDRILLRASLTALVVLAFLGGAVVTAARLFPGPQIEHAYQAAEALYTQLTEFQDTYRTNLWPPARRQGTGVTVHVPDRVQPGHTLYVSGHAQAVFLIDADGSIVHAWERRFSEIWRDEPGWVPNPRPDDQVYIRHAHPFPNGDLLVIYEGVGDTPYGYAVAKLDRHSEVIWAYPGRAHHQLDVGPDGTIYVLTHEIMRDYLDDVDYLPPPRLEDFVVVLSPDGEELRKIRLLTAFARSPYRALLYRVPGVAVSDPTHVNTVKYIDADAAANFAVGAEGQLLLSFREISTVAVLDMDAEEIVWATTGPWIAQHDPDILPDGSLLLFDNAGAYGGPAGRSRVIEFNPLTMEIAWQYGGTSEEPLESEIRSDQQRLENGNTLITESDGGRLVEVTREGEIVWEFINPVRDAATGERIPIISWAQRLDRTYFEPSLLLTASPPQGPGQPEPPL